MIRVVRYLIQLVAIAWAFIADSNSYSQPFNDDSVHNEVRQRKTTDLEFGRIQVELFGSDHVDAAKVLETQPKLAEKLAEMFAGIELPTRVHWDVRPPYQPYSDCIIGSGGYPTLVRVTAREEISPKDRIALLVRELCMARRLASAYGEIQGRALLGRIGEGEFVQLILRQEHQAGLDCNALLSEFDISTISPEVRLLTTFPNDFKTFFQKAEKERYRAIYKTAIAPVFAR